MEITSRPQERENPSPTNSPNSNGSSSNNCNASAQIRTPPLTPQTISRSDINPYPTTFVQADTSTFKQVVQMLTGSSETAKQASKQTQAADSTPSSKLPSSSSSIPPIKSTGQKKQGFKLYERRNSLKNGLMISPLIPGLVPNSGFSPRNNNKPAEILSPSILDFPSLVLSPVKPLREEEVFYKNKPSPSAGNSSEERAIAEKKFYVHPSPRLGTLRDSEPQLLPLFPMTSPRVSGSSS